MGELNMCNSVIISRLKDVLEKRYGEKDLRLYLLQSIQEIIDEFEVKEEVWVKFYDGPLPSCFPLFGREDGVVSFHAK